MTATTRNACLAVCVIVAVLLVCLALVSEHFARNHLPPTTDCRDLAEATAAAGAYAAANPGLIVRVLGTGSMSPWLRGGAPNNTVALVITDRTPFDGLKTGDVILFNHPAVAGLVLHQLVKKSGASWATSGLANRASDTGWLTAQNYAGKVAHAWRF